MFLIPSSPFSLQLDPDQPRTDPDRFSFVVTIPAKGEGVTEGPLE
jgi:hypothetical protein